MQGNQFFVQHSFATAVLGKLRQVALAICCQGAPACSQPSFCVHQGVSDVDLELHVIRSRLGDRSCLVSCCPASQTTSLDNLLACISRRLPHRIFAACPAPSSTSEHCHILNRHCYLVSLLPRSKLRLPPASASRVWPQPFDHCSALLLSVKSPQVTATCDSAQRA